MTIEKIQQRSISDEIELRNSDEAAGDSIRRLNDKFLADEIGRLLFGDSTTLLDDIINHPLAIDYFNVYLSLPIFGQRVLCHRTTHQLDFDPPFIAKHQICEPMYEEAKQWLIHCRLDNYIRTDIYIESLLGLLLINSDKIIESSSKLHAFIETASERQGSIFSTVMDVRQFHQFLLSTSGINYWNFFIDSMHFLRSRYSSQSHRIDISYLNFIHKYYSKQSEMPSITIDLHRTRMPDSSTPNEVWFKMAINAMHQLREYWLPRYFNQSAASSRLKTKPPTIKSIPKHIKSSTETPIFPFSSQLTNVNSKLNQMKLMKHTLGNISYLDYNPRQYILIQPSEQDNFSEATEVADENNIPIQTDNKTNFRNASSHRSIDQYVTDANIELFYRIFISDSLAGSPFLEYISQTIPKIEAIPLQTYIRFMTDAEILLSLSPGNFKQRILKHFTSRYLEVIATDALPSEVYDHSEEQRIELIQELLTHDNNQYFLLWKILLNITKFLMPHFLNYLKFDRLRFLVQGKSLNTPQIIDDLQDLLPTVHFDTLQTVPHMTTEIHSSPSIASKCAGQFDDLLESLSPNQYCTTEKLINTDEQCEFPPNQRFPPLSDEEVGQELRQFCSNIDWKDTEIILDQPLDTTTFIDDPSVHNQTKSNESLQLNSVDTYTIEIMNSAQEIFQIDRYISNLMNDSLHYLQSDNPLETTKSTVNSFVFKEVLRTDSSRTTTLLPFITNDRNQNRISQKSVEPKFLSSFGSYFINPPHITSLLETNSLSQSIDPILYNYLKNNYFKPINEFTIHHQFDSSPLLSHGLIKELTIDDMNIGHLSLDSTKIDFSFDKQNVLKVKLYTNDHIEFLLADITSYTIDSNKQEIQLQLENFQFPEITTQSLPKSIQSIHIKNISSYGSIRFAPKDKSNEVKNTFIEKRISYFQNDDQQQLLTFIQHEIHHHQWPLEQYIGMKGQRAWRALKLAADISNIDDGFMLNYHRDHDWIPIDEDLGSFGEQTYFIIRDFSRRVEQQKLSINKDNC